MNIAALAFEVEQQKQKALINYFINNGITSSKKAVRIPPDFILPNVYGQIRITNWELRYPYFKTTSSKAYYFDQIEYEKFTKKKHIILMAVLIGGIAMVLLTSLL